MFEDILLVVLAWLGLRFFQAMTFASDVISVVSAFKPIANWLRSQRALFTRLQLRKPLSLAGGGVAILLLAMVFQAHQDAPPARKFRESHSFSHEASSVAPELPSDGQDFIIVVKVIPGNDRASNSPILILEIRADR